jgi:hypothetical protein
MPGTLPAALRIVEGGVMTETDLKLAPTRTGWWADYGHTFVPVECWDQETGAALVVSTTNGALEKAVLIPGFKGLRQSHGSTWDTVTLEGRGWSAEIKESGQEDAKSFYATVVFMRVTGTSVEAYIMDGDGETELVQDVAGFVRLVDPNESFSRTTDELSALIPMHPRGLNPVYPD